MWLTSFMCNACVYALWPRSFVLTVDLFSIIDIMYILAGIDIRGRFVGLAYKLHVAAWGPSQYTDVVLLV